MNKYKEINTEKDKLAIYMVATRVSDTHGDGMNLKSTLQKQTTLAKLFTSKG